MPPKTRKKKGKKKKRRGRQPSGRPSFIRLTGELIQAQAVPDQGIVRVAVIMARGNNVMRWTDGPRHYVPTDVISAQPEVWVGEPALINHTPRRLVNIEDWQRRTASPVVGSITFCGMATDEVRERLSLPDRYNENDLAAEITVDASEIERRGYTFSDPPEEGRKQFTGVSVSGLFAYDHTAGEENGHEYDARWRGITKADHVAFLTDQPGACSIEAGCGVQGILAAGACDCGGDCCMGEENQTADEGNEPEGNTTQASGENQVAETLAAMGPRDVLGALVQAGFGLDGLVSCQIALGEDGEENPLVRELRGLNVEQVVSVMEDADIDLQQLLESLAAERSSLAQQLAELDPSELPAVLREAWVDVSAIVAALVQEETQVGESEEGNTEEQQVAAGADADGGEAEGSEGTQDDSQAGSPPAADDKPPLPEGTVVVPADEWASMQAMKKDHDRLMEAFNAREAEEKNQLVQKLLAAGAYDEEGARALNERDIDTLREMVRLAEHGTEKPRPRLVVSRPGNNNVEQAGADSGSGESPVVVPPSLGEIRKEAS